MPVTQHSYVERRECARCGAEVREGKHRHFCGEPYPLKVCDEIVVRRYVSEAEAERLREALVDLLDWASHVEGEGRLRRTEALANARAALNISAQEKDRYEA